MNEGVPGAEPFYCPTCGAKQVESAACRRCKSDLGLVLMVRDEARALHDECLRHLRTGSHRKALGAAIRRNQLTPDATSRRLLAVVHLFLGEYRQALDLSGLTNDEGGRYRFIED